MLRTKLTGALRYVVGNLQGPQWLVRTTVIAVVLSCVAALTAQAATATLAWDRNPEPDIRGYILFYGTVPGQYAASIEVGNVTQYVFTEPVEGPTYFFALQAVNTSGAKSALSTEVNSANHPLTDVWFDNGEKGLWVLTGTGVYQQINAHNPKAMTTGDLDGNGINELIVDFGEGLGLWVKWNGGEWAHLHNKTAIGLVTGDLDNDGKDELAVNFPGAGVWVLWSGTNWQPMHGGNPSRMVVGRLEAGGDDLIMDFPGSGIWIRRNNGSWDQLHSQNATAMVVGDFDRNSQDDIAIAFPGSGVWVFMNRSWWMQATANQPSKLAAGDVDGNGGAVLLGDFAPAGIWMLRSSTTWSQVHQLPAKQFLFADVDGDGRDEIVVDFGPTIGSWMWGTYSGWRIATQDSPETLVSRSTN
jgi:hypothetical protein